MGYSAQRSGFSRLESLSCQLQVGLFQPLVPPLASQLVTLELGDSTRNNPGLSALWIFRVRTGPRPRETASAQPFRIFYPLRSYSRETGSGPYVNQRPAPRDSASGFGSYPLIVPSHTLPLVVPVVYFFL